MAIKRVVGEALLEMADALEGKTKAGKIKVGLTLAPNEVGRKELIAGAVAAVRNTPGLEVVLIGPQAGVLKGIPEPAITHFQTGACERDLHQAMERLLQNKEITAAVTMHYNFPLGTATVGRVVTPGKGKEVFLATTTGTSDSHRVKAMVKNAIAGIACAKACGITRPRVGILNVEGARACERALYNLKKNGYAIEFAKSIRAGGRAVMRGNDLLAGSCEVMVTDSLTGNVLMKLLSAFTTGGEYEAWGYGYGPGIGAGFDRVVLILSRASGAPVVAGALRYAVEVVRGGILAAYRQELEQANRTGLVDFLAAETVKEAGAPVAPPSVKPVSDEIPGIDILDLEAAVRCLWQAGIYASSGMGCTGPVILVAPEDSNLAREVLSHNGFL